MKNICNESKSESGNFGIYTYKEYFHKVITR